MGKSRAEIPENEIINQRNIMRRVRELAIGRVDDCRPLALVDTYGCQQNEADSELIRGMLHDMGYSFTNNEYDADVIVINTCAIRENAENRVFGNIGALVHTKRAKPEQVIAVCGCMAGRPEAVEKLRNSYKHVDLVFPPHALWRFPELLESALSRGKRIFESAVGESVIAEGLPEHRDGGVSGGGTVKAWLSIMYGCNNYCSYCIVPYVRGRERSRKPEVILSAARKLVEDGYKDITLLGQNVNSYGNDLDGSSAEGGAIDFASLIRQINEIEGDFLIRFMTSHPKDAGDKLFKAMAECEKAARHIHLPFQSGNDRILSLMNRKYTRGQYLDRVQAARKNMPDIVLTSDVIVGFPGETDEEFEDTLSLIKEARFDALFTFIYSRRPGTPAAEMPDTVTREEKQRRFDALIELQNSVSDEKNAEYIGKILRVLVDGESGDARYPLKARTNGGRLVHLLGGKESVGSFVNAKITHCNSWSLFGEIV